MVDQHLKWDVHLSQLTTRSRKLIYLFVKLRSVLPMKVMKIVYYALAQSLLQYGIVGWGGAYTNVLKPVKTIQNLILKIILKKNRMYSTRLAFLEFSVLPIRQIYLKHIILYYKKLSLFHFINRTDCAITRREESGLVTVPRLLTTAGQRSFIYLSPLFFNILPSNLRGLLAQKNFGLHLKKYLVSSHGWDSAENFWITLV